MKTSPPVSPSPQAERGKKVPRNGEARARMWKVMRGLGVFTAFEIAATAGVKENSVRQYLFMLRTYGYLRVVGRERHGTGRPFQKYRLIKNTGPVPPHDVTVLYDPNLKTFAEKPPAPRPGDSILTGKGTDNAR